MKTKTILLLSALCASAVNFPIHAQDTYLIVDGTAHPAETGTTYQATTNNPPLTVIGISKGRYEGSYIGTNITLINNNALTDSIATDSGAYIIDGGQLSLTGGNITALVGTFLGGGASGTLNNVTINAVFAGVQAMYHSTLDLTGGNITLSGMGSIGIFLLESNATVSGVTIDSEAYSIGVRTIQSTLTLADSTLTTAYSGVTLQAGSSGTLNNVNITTTMDNDESGYGNGVNIWDSSTLTLTGGKIETSGSAAHGIVLDNASTGTITNANITATGDAAHGIVFNQSSGTLTDVNITATGEDASALYLAQGSATVNLNGKTLTGGITAAPGMLRLTGSNGTVLNSDITSANGSQVILTLTGPGTKLTGNATKDAGSAINLTLADGAAYIGSGTLTTLTLGDNTTLGYTENSPLFIDGGTLTIGDNILIDFSNLTETGTYTLLDWTNATTVTGNITDENFTTPTPGVEGTFTVNTDNKQLTFTATAIPEPSVYILLGIGLGILLITAHRRRRNQS